MYQITYVYIQYVKNIVTRQLVLGQRLGMHVFPRRSQFKHKIVLAIKLS